MTKPLFQRVRFAGVALVRVNNDDTEDQRFFLIDGPRNRPVGVSDRVVAEDGTETQGGRKAAEANLRADIEKIGVENVLDPRQFDKFPEFANAPDGVFWPKTGA